MQSMMESESSESSRWRLSVLRLLWAVETLDAASGEDGLGEAVVVGEAGVVGDAGSGGMRSGVGESLSAGLFDSGLDAGCAMRGWALCSMRFCDPDADCRACRDAAVSMARSALCDLVVGLPWSRRRWRLVVLLWTMLVVFPEEWMLLSVVMAVVLVACNCIVWAWAGGASPAVVGVLCCVVVAVWAWTELLSLGVVWLGRCGAVDEATTIGRGGRCWVSSWMVRCRTARPSSRDAAGGGASWSTSMYSVFSFGTDRRC